MPHQAKWILRREDLLELVGQQLAQAEEEDEAADI
jgi:hypothetical protein